MQFEDRYFYVIAIHFNELKKEVMEKMSAGDRQNYSLVFYLCTSLTVMLPVIQGCKMQK